MCQSKRDSRTYLAGRERHSNRATRAARQGCRQRSAGVRLSEVAGIRPRNCKTGDGVGTGVIVREDRSHWSAGSALALRTEVQAAGWHSHLLVHPVIPDPQEPLMFWLLVGGAVKGGRSVG